LTVTAGCWEAKPAFQPCMAACWALEPAPLRVPVSLGALSELPPAELPAAFAFSFDAPQADSASAPATATVHTAARVVVLSFNWVPFDRSPDVAAGQGEVRRPRR